MAARYLPALRSAESTFLNEARCSTWNLESLLAAGPDRVLCLPLKDAGPDCAARYHAPLMRTVPLSHRADQISTRIRRLCPHISSLRKATIRRLRPAAACRSPRSGPGARGLGLPGTPRHSHGCGALRLCNSISGSVPRWGLHAEPLLPRRPAQASRWELIRSGGGTPGAWLRWRWG